LQLNQELDEGDQNTHFQNLFVCCRELKAQMRPSSILALALLLPLLASPALGAPADDPRPIVPASEILAKIERGEPVEYNGVIVEGDLDLGEVDLPTKHVERTEMELNILKINNVSKLINSSIIIKNCEISDNVDLGNSIFQNGVSFEGTNFTNLTWFSGSSFEGNADFRDSQSSGGDANFWWANFGGPANFREVEFGGGALFCWAKFNRYADFMRAVFSSFADFSAAEFSFGDADFSHVVFSDIANFNEVQFSGRDVNFRGAKFSGRANFEKAQFTDRDANFRGAEFSGGDANFEEAHFSGGEANFSGADFSGGNVEFVGADFSGSNADFRKVDFGDDVSFEDSSFDHANLTLEDAREIRILRLSNSTFENESTISLKGTDYEWLYVHWDQIKYGFVYNGEAYLILIKNLRNIEYFEDADDCYYQYRRERQAMRSWWEMAKYIDILAWLTCGYGIRPGYTLGWSLVLVSFFGIVFWAGNGIYRITTQNQNNAIEKAEKEWRFSSTCCQASNKIYKIIKRILAAPKILRKVLSALLKIRPSTLRRLPGRIWNSSFVTDLSLKDALYFSTMVFVSQPPHDWRPKEGWKYWVMLEDVLGWLLLALFLVTLGNVMIR